MSKIVFTMGDLVEGVYPMQFTVATPRTWYNRLRFWLFFKFFPFEFKGWEEVGNADDRLEPIENITYSTPSDYIVL